MQIVAELGVNSLFLFASLVSDLLLHLIVEFGLLLADILEVEEEGQDRGLFPLPQNAIPILDLVVVD